MVHRISNEMGFVLVNRYLDMLTGELEEKLLKGIEKLIYVKIP